MINKSVESSDKNIKLSDFDLLGMFELEDVSGIEYIVTPIGNGKYISRGEMYYTRYTCSAASSLREYFKSILSTVSGKKAFVLLDHMANLSGKVYYEQIQKAINYGDFSGIEIAKKCLYDDISNVIQAIEGKPITIFSNVLPSGDEYIAERSIECDNLGLLYVFTSCFNVPEGYNVLNTGLGGIYIGPFFKKMHGTEWTNLLKSKYVDEQSPNRNSYDILSSMVDPNVFHNRKVLFLDDNIGTGDTTREIATELNIAMYDVKYGAVQYNWMNFYRVGAGLKKDISRFNPFEIDYLTPYNYPGHKLIKHAVAMLRGKRDLDGNEPSQDYWTPPGQIYSYYLSELKHYKQANLPDLITLIQKGAKFSSDANVHLFSGDMGRTHRKFKKSSIDLINSINDFNGVVYGYEDPVKKREEMRNSKGQMGEE